MKNFKEIEVGNALIEDYKVGNWWLDEVLYNILIDEENLTEWEDEYNHEGREKFINELKNLGLIEDDYLIIKQGSILLNKEIEDEFYEKFTFIINNKEIIFFIYIDNLKKNYFKFK